LFNVAQTKRDIRAGLGKRESNSAAEVASGSSYQRGLTVKTKSGQGSHDFSRSAATLCNDSVSNLYTQ
jgi:hypothetical protein